MKLDEAVTIDDDVRQFVRWALGLLGRSASHSFEHNDAAPIQVDRAFVSQLIEQLNADDRSPYAIPAQPAARVHEISARLLNAYQVDGGKLQLSGCTLEERPVLRQTILDEADAGQPHLTHRFADARGFVLSSAECGDLGLYSVQPPTGTLPKLGREDVRAWCASVDSHAQGEPENGEVTAEPSEQLASVVWCPFAEGKIEFVIGKVSAEIPFAGWARHLVTGLVAAPAFTCPVTGIQSHHIVATDDGRITVADAIRVCAVSDRRVLLSELESCELTGQMVLPEYLLTCPVSGQKIVESAFETCGTCLQAVSPACVAGGVCAACRTMQSIRTDDPRMARIFGEYPRLDQWRNWRISETATSYILIAAALIKRLLVVINKEDLELVRVATRNRFSSHWSEPPLSERQDLLR